MKLFKICIKPSMKMILIYSEKTPQDSRFESVEEVTEETIFSSWSVTGDGSSISTAKDIEKACIMN